MYQTLNYNDIDELRLIEENELNEDELLQIEENELNEAIKISMNTFDCYIDDYHLEVAIKASLLEQQKDPSFKQQLWHSTSCDVLKPPLQNVWINHVFGHLLPRDLCVLSTCNRFFNKHYDSYLKNATLQISCTDFIREKFKIWNKDEIRYITIKDMEYYTFWSECGLHRSSFPKRLHRLHLHVNNAYGLLWLKCITRHIHLVVLFVGCSKRKGTLHRTTLENCLVQKTVDYCDRLIVKILDDKMKYWTISFDSSRDDLQTVLNGVNGLIGS